MSYEIMGNPPVLSVLVDNGWSSCSSPGLSVISGDQDSVEKIINEKLPKKLPYNKHPGQKKPVDRMKPGLPKE